MGLRHRSIRLRVGILIVVPVLCLLGLYAFVVSITLSNARTEAHAKSIRDDLLSPLSAFQQQLAVERHLALLLLAAPGNTAAQSAFGGQEAATTRTLSALTAAIGSPAVLANASPYEVTAIKKLINNANQLSYIRGDVTNDSFSLPQALSSYDSLINDGYTVLDEAIGQQTDVPIVTQALGVINLDRAGQAALAEGDLLTADLAQRKFPASDRVAFAQLASLRQSLLSTTLPELQPAYLSIFNGSVMPTLSNSLTGLENKIISTPWHAGPPAALTSAPATFTAYTLALRSALSKAAVKLQAQTSHASNTTFLQLILAAGLGLLGTIASIALSLIIGRGLVRQLRDLRESALSLAHDKLPAVIAKLRAGQPVDLAEYEPGEISTSNEIEQVQHAFNIVQQTAVQSAVDEARLRRGISDVFRNLAGRSQSLLHRQLTLLDGMERRTTEPDELEDLFRIDHLTTRMRRHAEGLIILSGEAPARGWRQPVPLVDVLRAAVAEVEDYTRIRVLARTNAAVAGHAVADIIHMIAELAENATVFSPPNTPVRIQGDIVGRGFAIEIEDRGLGISSQRLAEINANLANPPQFDLSGSDRLGLFIAGQLAQRHDIKITLQGSVFGGTTAIVLIPIALVVEEGSYERDPALTAGQPASAQSGRIAGRHAALSQAAETNGNGRATAEVDPDYAGTSPGYAANALVIGSQATAEVISPISPIGASGAGNGFSTGSWDGTDSASGAFGPGISSTGLVSDRPGFSPDFNTDFGADFAADRTGFAAGRADLGANRAEFSANRGDSGAGIGDSGANVGGFGASRGAFGAGRGSQPAVRQEMAGEDTGTRSSASQLTEHGLPLRVRQANLAPQLRNSGPAKPVRPASFAPSAYGRPDSSQGGSPGLAPSGSSFSGPSPSGAPPAGIDVFAAANRSASPAPSPESARDTVSALQRGWQAGLAEAAAKTSGWPDQEARFGTVGPATGDPGNGGPGTGEPGNGDTGNGGPGASDHGAGEPSAGEPSAGEPSAGEPSAGKPGTGGPDEGEPVAGQPAAISSVVPAPADPNFDRGESSAEDRDQSTEDSQHSTE